MNKTLHIQCKHCHQEFAVNSPGKVGTYSTTCPCCHQKMAFKLVSPYKTAGQSASPQKAMTIKCPSCKTMFPAPLPSTPGSYGIKCPSCKHEIRIKIVKPTNSSTNEKE